MMVIRGMKPLFFRDRDRHRLRLRSRELLSVILLLFLAGCGSRFELNRLRSKGDRLIKDPKNKDLVEDVVAYVGSQDGTVRREALIYIATTFDDLPEDMKTEVTRMFVDGLTDPDLSVRREAALGLDKVKDPDKEAIRRMCEAMVENKFLDVGYFLAKTIGGKPQHAAISLPYLQMIAEENRNRRTEDREGAALAVDAAIKELEMTK